MDKETKDHLDSIIDLLGKAFGSIDYALEQFVRVAETLPKENQTKIKESIEILLDHMEASCKETRLCISPIPNNSKEYVR